MTNLHPSPNRAGFTLVELMITIGVIAILAGILVVALGGAGVRSRQEATAALIKKLNLQVRERLEAIDRLRNLRQWETDATSYYPPSSYSTEQAKILLLKNRLQQIFPQSFAEFNSTNNSDWNKGDEYGKFRATRLDLPSPKPTDPNTESAALLYYALTNGRVPGIPSLDPSEFRTSEVADTDGDGFLEFIDAWGRPLRFYRWPTRLICPTGTFEYDTTFTPQRPVRAMIDRQRASILISGLPANNLELARDQDDPIYHLSITTQSAAEAFERQFHTPFARHDFLIVSAGPDGLSRGGGDAAFGLYDPTNKDPSKLGYLAQPIMTQDGLDALTDNITNRNRP